jgi:hypothetical protein
VTIQEFAAQHRFRVKQPPKAHLPGPHPDRPFVPGRRGWLVASDRGGEWTMFLCGSSWLIPGTLRDGRALGMTAHGRGEDELMMWFDPENAEQVAFAGKTIQAYLKRQFSPEQRAAMAARLTPFRSISA